MGASWCYYTICLEGVGVDGPAVDIMGDCNQVRWGWWGVLGGWQGSLSVWAEKLVDY